MLVDDPQNQKELNCKTQINKSTPWRCGNIVNIYTERIADVYFRSSFSSTVMRYSDDQMRAITSQMPGDWTVCSTVYSANSKENTKASHHWLFVRRIHLGVTGGFRNGHAESVWTIWGFWCQKQVFQAWISNCIPQTTYLSLPEIPASGTKVLISWRHQT